MGRGRAEILEAIIRLECPAGEYSPAQGAEALEEAQGQGASSTGQADSREPVPGGRLTAHRPERPTTHQAATMLEMVMVAYDPSSTPAASRQKLGKKWLKLAQKAHMRSSMPGRVRRAVAEALREDPEAAVLTLRGVVESKI